ncbi:MAG: ATP-binding protein [Bacteroidales bacterium]|nr:ATP-binding protein [Bacteroidales bacterium]
MFKRDIIHELENWRLSSNRKPLILRGARQVGKTTAVNIFAEQFEQYIYLNLERSEDREIFEKYPNTEDLIQAIFLIKNKQRKIKNTLLFIDEIQEAPSAIAQLRYFYEQAPDIFILAAGSLLETLFDKSIRFPVGRVEYRVIRPVSFIEFLEASQENTVLELLNTTPIPAYAHDKILKLFNTYALLGGMPEIIENYIKNHDLTSLKQIYESLLISYMDDVEKYARNSTQVQLIRHAIRSAFDEAGKRIRFHGFGSSNYGSREMGEGLRILEKAMLIKLVYPTTGTENPIVPNKRKSPRLQVLDTGLLNYFVGIQQELIGIKDLSDSYRGIIAEHLVGQELLAKEYNILSDIIFWIREKKTSTAEVDYLYKFKNFIIPIEVKSGATGKLKSLHLFMDLANHNMAIRIYSGNLTIDKVITHQNKEYYLLNLPYYLLSKLDNYLIWFEKEISQ